MKKSQPNCGGWGFFFIKKNGTFDGFDWSCPTRGPCHRCGKPGTKQLSIVDPLSPSLEILCPEHHEAYRNENKMQTQKCQECQEWQKTTAISEQPLPDDLPPAQDSKYLMMVVVAVVLLLLLFLCI